MFRPSFMAPKWARLVLLVATLGLMAAGVFAQDHSVPAEPVIAPPATPQRIEHLEADGAGHGAVHGEAGHADEGHGGGHKGGGAPELPTAIHVLNSVHLSDGRTIGDTDFGHFIHKFEKQIFLLIITTFLAIIVFGSLRLRSLRPGRWQAFVELLVEGLMNFFEGILGHHNRKHVPFFCTLFLFIWINNLSAAVPLFGPATAKYPTTLALAILVFFYVQFFAIKEGGIKHYFWHLLGSPKDAIGWSIAPFMLILEIIGNLAKPLSLSLRLFGNIMGEDILLGVFLLLGLMLGGAIIPNTIIGVPLHLPFLFLVLLTSTVQALVFSLLGAIYLAMALPHHDDHEHEDEHELLPGANASEEASGHIDAGHAPFVG